LDADGFVVSAFTGNTVITNREPQNLKVYEIQQDSLKPSDVTIYRIIFTPVNPIPSQGSIQMTYPQ
jgi:hypothetical protein